MIKGYSMCGYKIPEIKFTLVRLKLIKKRRKLKGKWTLEPAENLPCAFGPSLPIMVTVRKKGQLRKT